jgi:hypothetical protein
LAIFANIASIVNINININITNTTGGETTA